MRGNFGAAAGGVALVALGASLVVPLGLDAAAATLPAGAPRAVTVAPGTSPAFVAPACGTGIPAYNHAGSGDAADPQVVYSAGTYYAFTTGNALGNHIAVLVSSSPNSGYGPSTHTCSGSTALPNPSPWEQPNTQTSPGVFQYGGHWVMFYDAAQAGHASDSGFDCVTVATAQSISPSAAQFSDVSNGPLQCQATGSIDPQPFVDPTTGIAYLVWKQNDGGSSAPAYLWAQQLNATGTGFAPGSSASLLFANNTVTYPWEATVENPSMVAAGGGFYLAFSARHLHGHRVFRSDCHMQQPARSLRGSKPDPHLVRLGARARWRSALLGPEWRLVARLCGVAGWLTGLHLVRLWCRTPTLRHSGFPAQYQRAGSLSRSDRSVRLLHGGLRRGHLQLRELAVLRIAGWPPVEQAGGRDGGHPRRRGLLARGE